MEWVRCDTIGHGSFGTVNLAIPRSQNPLIPPLMAVKSCGVSHSSSLVNEKSILDQFRDCPEIIQCFGDEFSFENGEKLYNLFLEYASGGNLADKIRNSGQRRLPEFEIRRYTKSILKGLLNIHKIGYVHCDIKLQNILLFGEGLNKVVAKIADFGLARKSGERREQAGFEVRGTPLYMSPETVNGGDQESPADIWALGCAVVEMVTGSPAWVCSPMTGVAELLLRIGVGEEIPEIPGRLSELGKDFLGKCFVKDPSKRWTAEMLLNHPFINGHDDDDHHNTVPSKHVIETPSTSPRCHFDFPDWETVGSSMDYSITYLPSPNQSPESNSWRELNMFGGCQSTSPAERLGQLFTDQRPDWSDSGNWVTVR